MPTYLCHGFRWNRRSIRVFVIVQNIDDASPEWIIREKSALALLQSFYNLFDFLPPCFPPALSRSSASGYHHHSVASPEGDGDDDSRASQTHKATPSAGTNGPSRSRSRSRSKSRTRSRQKTGSQEQKPAPASQFPPKLPPVGGGPTDDEVLRSQEWSVVKVLEEYDPLDLDEVSRPHAYVADYAVRVDLSASVTDEIRRYEERLRGDRNPPVTGGKKGGGWFEKLRDQLQRGEDIRWYVVVNGDEVREFPDELLPQPAATSAQQEHHEQYMLQQLIFERNDREKGRERRWANRPDFPADRERRPPPAVPEKDGPALGPKPSVEVGSRPKTPRTGAFKRLFGRGKADYDAP